MGVVETTARGVPFSETEEIEVTVARSVRAGLSETAAQPGVEAKGSATPIAGFVIAPVPVTARSVTRRS